jgi:predicted dehydrogenase
MDQSQLSTVPTSLPYSRRTFLHAGAAGLAMTAASYGRVLGANDRVGVGFIGYGLIGKRHVLDFQAQADVDCVGICDAHSGRLEEGRAQLGSAARASADFRELLDHRDVDAVVVSTPDHWHALMTMLACAAGKDVYVEKPLSLCVREGRWMVDTAARHQRVVQVGTQQRSGLHYQKARELIRNGHIGQVMSVRMQHFRNVMPGFGKPADSNPPAELDWNRMLGPAPQRAYNPNRGIYHFRWFWDYSGGQMTNLGHHALDIMHWTLGGAPSAVTSIGGRWCLTDNGETPDTQDALFEFTAAENRPPPPATGQPPAWTAIWSHRESGNGGGVKPYPTEFYGTRGMLGIDRKGFVVRADKKIPPENHIPRFTGPPPVGGVARVEPAGEDEFWTTPIDDQSGSEAEQFTRHVRNFLDCVKSRETPASDLESAHRVSTMCHLANLSLRLGRKLRWDSVREDVIGDPKASAQLVRPYRAPWDAELRTLLAAVAKSADDKS